jgi:hypothetical protein
MDHLHDGVLLDATFSAYLLNDAIEAAKLEESAPAPTCAALSTPAPQEALPRRIATDEYAGADVVLGDER